jgi:hypothetical protein
MRKKDHLWIIFKSLLQNSDVICHFRTDARTTGKEKISDIDPSCHRLFGYRFSILVSK